MKLLLDMNLSPIWSDFLNTNGYHAQHWSKIGDITATDETIFDWARKNKYIIITQDIDFTRILALSNSGFPSVILIRANFVLPENLGSNLISVLKENRNDLELGAHIVIDTISSRLRILPLRS